MATMIFKAFAKKLFGVNYIRLKRIMPVYLIIFWGLRITDIRLQISPSILYLMVTVFTAGVMWQALSSESNAIDLQHIFMLPIPSWAFVLSYVAALSLYALLTKTAGLLAVVLALSVWNTTEIWGSILCGTGATLAAACIYFLRQRARWPGGYPFYPQPSKYHYAIKSSRRHLIWHYLLRYFISHKNYFANTIVMWCIACVLPLFFRQMKGLYVAPIGFAILSINTPLCILLSSNPALDQAVRFLPDQKKKFCLPYCLFIFLCNMIADTIFLSSFWLLLEPITWQMVLTAVFFALQSAIFSILLEWFCPVRNWKIESDLWHHPRKYVVPVSMLLLAGIVGALPTAIYILVILLGIEVVAFLLPRSAD